MGDYAVVETHPNIKAHILESAWASRAWTYQEGHLAKRRLIFTEHQVAYICDFASRVETISSPIRNRDCKDILSMDDIFSSSRLQHGLHYRDRCIAQITSRKLSYDRDAMNVCAGVLQSWSATSSEDLPSGPRSLWGLQITQNDMDLAWSYSWRV
jgi:hypothetical protein